jgi:hypothetical protein
VQRSTFNFQVQKTKRYRRTPRTFSNAPIALPRVGCCPYLSARFFQGKCAGFL